MNTAEAIREARSRFGSSATAIDHGAQSSPSVRYTVRANPDARGIREGLAVGPSFDECFRRLDANKRNEAKHAVRDTDRAALRKLRTAW